MDDITIDDLSSQQRTAYNMVQNWLNGGYEHQQVFRLFGYAGTGKTTIARLLASSVSHCLFGAFTGKAASVLASKGCSPASTVHKMIYLPKDQAQARLKELQKEEQSVLGDMERHPRSGPELQEQLREVREKIRREKELLARPHFVLNSESELYEAQLGVLDEVSMLDKAIGNDLLSFNTPLLVMGDPAQLPPIKGAGFFMETPPDITLTEIHRQAAGNPILQLATTVRSGGTIDNCDLGEARVISNRPAPDDVMAADQILCGRNRTRKNLNRRVRELLGRKSPLPERGDRLVCLRNNHEIGILNGTIWTVRQNHGSNETGKLTLEIENEDGYVIDAVTVHQAHFLDQELDWYERRDAEEFDFGYALTVHKAQGSQWDKVVLFDDWGGSDRRKWLYTGITRAAKELLIVQ